MYESITTEMQKVREHKQQVVILGDFNAKEETTIQGNKETITKGKRLLLKMIEKETIRLDMQINRCKRLWTRKQGKEKSVIDHVMFNTEYLNSINEMIIDRTKKYATYRLE